MKKTLFSLGLICFFTVLTLEASVKGISNYDLAKLMKKRIVIIDIRDQRNWKKTGVIPSSYKITYVKKKALRVWLRVFTRIVKSKSTAFVLVGTNGKEAERLACALRDDIGYKKIYFLEGGIDKWKAEDGKLVKY